MNYGLQSLTEESWKNVLGEEFKKPYVAELWTFLKSELRASKVIYPRAEDLFSALNFTPFDKVKVVVIGQDPYHGENQAHGLCFSVKKNVPIPPSLVNIYKELHHDLGCEIPKHGNLEAWAKQGVLLLNNVLTVRDGEAGSHHGKGWEIFTDKIIEILNDQKENLVFILWGAPAQKKGSKINSKKHLVIKSPHPSPLSSYRGFFGSKPFSQTNIYLREHKMSEIDWKISP